MRLLTFDQDYPSIVHFDQETYSLQLNVTCIVNFSFAFMYFLHHFIFPSHSVYLNSSIVVHNPNHEYADNFFVMTFTEQFS